MSAAVYTFLFQEDAAFSDHDWHITVDVALAVLVE